MEALLPSLVTGVAVGVSAGYLGSLMVLERMALVGDALSHVALPGLALGILFNFNPFLGAFALLFLSAILVWRISSTTRLPYEAVIAAVFTLALAVGILIIPAPELLEALFGDVTKVGALEAAAAVIISGVAMLLTKLVYNKIVLGMISEELAVSTGVNVGRANLLYLLLVSLIVAVGIRIVGTLLVGFMVVVPAAAARNLSQNLSRYSALSAVFGAASSTLGVLVSGYLGLPSGPLIVLCGVSLFAATILLRVLGSSA